MEEIRLDVTSTGLVGVYSRATDRVMLVVYRGHDERRPRRTTTDEAPTIEAFAPDELPWDEMAFWSTTAALRDATHVTDTHHHQPRLRPGHPHHQRDARAARDGVRLPRRLPEPAAAPAPASRTSTSRSSAAPCTQSSNGRRADAHRGDTLDVPRGTAHEFGGDPDEARDGAVGGPAGAAHRRVPATVNKWSDPQTGRPSQLQAIADREGVRPRVPTRARRAGRPRSSSSPCSRPIARAKGIKAAVGGPPTSRALPCGLSIAHFHEPSGCSCGDVRRRPREPDRRDLPVDDEQRDVARTASRWRTVTSISCPSATSSPIAGCTPSPHTISPRQGRVGGRGRVVVGHQAGDVARVEVPLEDERQLVGCRRLHAQESNRRSPPPPGPWR